MDGAYRKAGEVESRRLHFSRELLKSGRLTDLPSKCKRASKEIHYSRPLLHQEFGGKTNLRSNSRRGEPAMRSLQETHLHLRENERS